MPWCEGFPWCGRCGLALFLTLFIMQPVMTDVYNNALLPYMNQNMPFEQALAAAEAHGPGDEHPEGGGWRGGSGSTRGSGSLLRGCAHLCRLGACPARVSSPAAVFIYV